MMFDRKNIKNKNIKIKIKNNLCRHTPIGRSLFPDVIKYYIFIVIVGQSELLHLKLKSRGKTLHELLHGGLLPSYIVQAKCQILKVTYLACFSAASLYSLVLFLTIVPLAICCCCWAWYAAAIWSLVCAGIPARFGFIMM